MTQRQYAIILGIVVTFVSLPVCAADGPMPDRMDPKNREILGIVLGTSSVDDIRHVLGPAAETALPLGQHELSQLCYRSPGSDRTVLQFVLWSQPVEFKLFRGSLQDIASCSKSSRVTAALTTRAGLRLGMIKSRVVALLGKPTSIKGSILVFDFSRQRPMTPDEKKSVENNPAYRTVDTIGITEKIEIGLTGSRVSRVDVTYSETW